MSLAQAATQRVRLPLLPALLAGAVILGILGMHAFTHHEPLPPSAGGHHAFGSVSGESATGRDIDVMSIAATVTALAGGTGALSSATATASGAARAAEASRIPAHSTGDMVMLCASMLLAAAASALLALRVKRVASATLTRVKPLARAHASQRAGRAGTGPPYLLEFSVVRC